jgi:demethylmenaquinone methyltransferase/2-methoxy-6-polyprenyl-1,4-benzoquinol methylase
MPVDALETAALKEAAAGGAGKRQYVRQVFSEIAPSYDLLNHLLSFNIDVRWRRKAVAALDWRRTPAGSYLDLCAGTLDVSATLAGTPGFSGQVIGADFAEPMVRAGLRKTRDLPIRPVVGDALELPLRADSMAGAVVAFGIRNVSDLDAGLREVHRVLAVGARFVILEFTTPRSVAMRSLYHLYFHGVLPRVGRLVSGHRTAYTYLPRSVASFPIEEALADRMRDAGFHDVTWRTLSFGIAAIHVGVKS